MIYRNPPGFRVAVLKGHQPRTDGGHRSTQQGAKQRLAAWIPTPCQDGGKEVVLAFQGKSW